MQFGPFKQGDWTDSKEDHGILEANKRESS